MFLLLFFLWIVFNGQVTLEIVLFGLVIAGAMYLFVCKFMDYSVVKDLYISKKLLKILRYFLVLLWEIIKANTITIKTVLAVHKEPNPSIVTFAVDIKSDMGKALLANSITLTPGTITVALEDNVFTVHCLDKSMAEGIESSVFVRLISDMESDYDDFIRKQEAKQKKKETKDKNTEQAEKELNETTKTDKIKDGKAGTQA